MAMGTAFRERYEQGRADEQTGECPTCGDPLFADEGETVGIRMVGLLPLAPNIKMVRFCSTDCAVRVTS